MDRLQFSNIYDEVEEFQPEDFLTASESVSSSSLTLLKSLYDFTKGREANASSGDSLRFTYTFKSASGKKKKKAVQLSKAECPLQKLIVEDFGEEQIWEELQLQNTLIYETLVSSVSKVLAYQNRPKKPKQEESDMSDEGLLDELSNLNKTEEEDGEDSDYINFDEKIGRNNKKTKLKSSYPKSIVDDKFFSLAQMTEHMEAVEAEIENKGDSGREETQGNEEEDIDLFENTVDKEDDEEGDYYYKDFFDPPLNQTDADNKRRTVSFAEGDGPVQEDDDENDDMSSDEEDEPQDDLVHEKQASDDKILDKETEERPLSNFEKRRRKIEDTITLMEDEALKPKPWQLTGEVTAETRPENSLLEEHLVYDHLLRQAPEMTVKTTQKLEDIIKQRIKDQAWDDVQRKFKPVENPSEYKKRLILDAEKSKVSLADIYEKEYVEKESKNDDMVVEEEKDPEAHIVIQKCMKELFRKLDALSNYYYTPKAPSIEIKVVSNVSAITAEEVAPITMSNASLLAPQEIKAPVKGEVKGTAERTSTDKKRERRLKKKKQHLKRLAQEEKARSRGFGLRSVKLAENVVKKSKQVKKDDDGTGYQKNKELKSSKAFFARLQEQAQTHIQSIAKRKKSLDPKTLSAKRFKL